MPLFPLTLQETYREQGFFNVTVDFDKYIRDTDGEIALLLKSNAGEAVLKAHVNRKSANRNGTPRIMGGPALRDWFQRHYQVGDRVNVDIRSPTCISINTSNV